MVAVNVLYNVGARDESPDKTGFAHLFEHLMFGGSAHAPDFDTPMQMAGGDNNAFTNNDITNFHSVLPVENIDTALWLEADRMSSLNFDEQILETQRKVVLEEFKETCLNEPYGDAWHHLFDMAYKVHPYRWPTIGKVPQHLEQATIQDVQSFFDKYYCPNNAVISIAGNLSTEEALEKVQYWFGDIPAGTPYQRRLPQEPPQQRLEKRISEAKVPGDAIYLTFHAPARNHLDYYAAELLSDVLGNGLSSRLYQRLVKDDLLFSDIDCYVTGSIDPGLLVVEGKPVPGVSLEQAAAAIWEELRCLQAEEIPVRELQKIKNKVESAMVFSELNVLNKAMNLAFFELLGDADLINTEFELYQRVTSEQLHQLAQQLFTEENCCELLYQGQPSN